MKKDELKPRVRDQIDRGLDALSDEFDDVATPEQVREIGQKQLDEILPEARVVEFIPSLVNSATRAELLQEEPNEEHATAKDDVQDPSPREDSDTRGDTMTAKSFDSTMTGGFSVGAKRKRDDTDPFEPAMR